MVAITPTSKRKPYGYWLSVLVALWEEEFRPEFRAEAERLSEACNLVCETLSGEDLREPIEKLDAMAAMAIYKIKREHGLQ